MFSIQAPPQIPAIVQCNSTQQIDTYLLFKSPTLCNQAANEKTPSGITKSRTPYEFRAGFVFVLQDLDAELAHEILHVIVHGKVHYLACIVEFLFDLILYINGIAIPCETPRWSDQRACKVTLRSYAAGNLITAYLVFDDCAFEVGNGTDESFGVLGITIRST